LTKNLKLNIKNYQVLLPQDKKLIYHSLISLKRKKKSLKFNPDLQHKVPHLMQIKINAKEFRQNQGTPGGGQNQGNQQGGGAIRPNQPIRPGFNKGVRPAIVAKVEPTEEEVKNQIRETLEKLQGKGGKSKAAKYRRDKRDTHRQRSDDEQKQSKKEAKLSK
jgi:hypothetical protein